MSALEPLPVDEIVEELQATLRDTSSLVLFAPPGAGKTTRVPPALLPGLGDRGRIVVLEPRRIAARSAARRIASERGWQTGAEVGWQIRFERRFGPDTGLVFVTEGILVQWLQRDPFLEGIAAVVFDEVHERSLFTDLSLALTRRVQREVRPELRIVAMSATLDPGPLQSFLDAPLLRSEGRLHPVEIEYAPPPQGAPLERSVARAVGGALAATSGDVLVFLPGRGEIDRCRRELESLSAAEIDVLPLYGALSPEEQDRALRPGPRRRVVLATNVAETSVTVEGVTAVVDSGLARQPSFDPAVGLDRLELVRIARAAATQRAGRAGRQGPGLCIRLWSEDDHRSRREFEPPEIQRVDLSWCALQLLAFGEHDLASFPWLEPPDPARLERSLRELRDLGALEERGLSRLGQDLARLPLSPRLGRLVLESRRRGVEAEGALFAAMLSERPPKPSRRAGTGRSDLLVWLDREGRRPARHLSRARDQILATLDRLELEEEIGTPPHGEDEREDALLHAVAVAWLDRLCCRREPGSERAVMVGGRGVRLARESVVGGDELFVAVQLDAGRSGPRSEALVRVASAVERGWLPTKLLVTEDELVWNREQERVEAWRTTRFEDLVLERRALPTPAGADVEEMLITTARQDPERAFDLERPELAGLLARLDFLGGALPELDLPPASSLLAELLPLLASGKSSFAELGRAPLRDALLGQLTFEQRQALEQDAPERIEVPSGSRVRVQYEEGSPPVLPVRIQELFGLAETPRLARGRVPLLLHLLAPNGRPQQVTDDLASFWRNTYPEVRKELAGRYPKHAWPEDPLRAEPERRPQRRRK